MQAETEQLQSILAREQAALRMRSDSSEMLHVRAPRAAPRPAILAGPTITARPAQPQLSRYSVGNTSVTGGEDQSSSALPPAPEVASRAAFEAQRPKAPRM